MTSAFLTRQQLAERMGTTPGVASAILAEKGVLPVNFGRGRGRGVRWYAQAVDMAMRQMHDEAQVKNPPKKIQPPRVSAYDPFAGKTARQIYEELTLGHPVQ